MTKIALGIWVWFATMIATATMAQGVVDVHSHIITPEFVSSLEKEGRLMDEGFPLPKYNVESHLKWMDRAGVQTSVLTLAAPQPTICSMALTIPTLPHRCSRRVLQG